jgi:hypothetical protein
MACIGYFDHIRSCHRADLNAFVPWHVGGDAVGFVHRERVPLLLARASPFRLVAGRLELAGDDFASRSAALAGVVAQLIAAGGLRPVLGENYPVAAGIGPPLLQVDRAAVTWFGVRAAGVHLNGYVQTEAGLCLWNAIRSRRKRTFPGHLDNVVAGGQAIGMAALETLAKEGEEEAGMPFELAALAVPVGSLSYVQQDGLSLKRDTLACFDLELPGAFVPRACDGEVEEFLLRPAAEVAASLRRGDPWKPNSAMVTLGFLLRHGSLDAELPPAERWRLWRALHGELA